MSKSMKKIIISLSISILTVCGIFAQDVKFGVRGGLNLPNIMAGGTNTPVSEGYSSRLAAGWGDVQIFLTNGVIFFVVVEKMYYLCSALFETKKKVCSTITFPKTWKRRWQRLQTASGS